MGDETKPPRTSNASQRPDSRATQNRNNEHARKQGRSTANKHAAEPRTGRTRKRPERHHRNQEGPSVCRVFEDMQSPADHRPAAPHLPRSQKIATRGRLDVRPQGHRPTAHLRKDVEYPSRAGPTEIDPREGHSFPHHRGRANFGADAHEGLTNAQASQPHDQIQTTAPHYYPTLDIDMTDALDFRKQANAHATDEQKVSINDLIVKACAIAIERHPKFNAEVHDTGLAMHDSINVCIGIALEDGLIAPAILDCQSKSLGRIAIEAKDLIERAKAAACAPTVQRRHFTITKLGHTAWRAPRHNQPPKQQPRRRLRKGTGRARRIVVVRHDEGRAQRATASPTGACAAVTRDQSARGLRAWR